MPTLQAHHRPAHAILHGFRISSTVRTRPFHTSTPCSNHDLPNHYAALELPHNASTKDVKRQFYALSKRYHPDTYIPQAGSSKKDAEARFHRISEAYHVLSHESSRARYDHEYYRVHGNGAHRQAAASGSHSSHQSRARGPAGSRPASGLSKRHGVFRGPPPSFYRQYGQEQPQAPRDDEAGEDARSTTGRWGGFSPGQADPDWNPEPLIRHWDRRRHLKTQEKILERAKVKKEELQADRLQRLLAERGRPEPQGGAMARFVVTSAVIGLVVAATVAIASR